MRKTLFAGVVMLLSSLAAMATAPSGQGGSHMSEFKLQSGVSQTDVSRSNLTCFQDLTSEMEKERLARKGIKVSHFVDTPQTDNGRILPTKSPMREGEETYTLTVNLKYDKKEVNSVGYGVAFPNYANGFWFYNEESEDQQPDKIDFILPAGNYDIEVIMNTKNSDYIFLTVNELDITEDCMITLDAADATIEIVWDALMPDGTPPCAEIIVYDPNTFNVIEERPGNSLILYSVLNIFNKKHQLSRSIEGVPQTYFIGDEKYVIGICNIKTNPNDDYRFFYYKEAIGVDGGYIIPLMADAIKSQIVTNNIENYITIKPEFAYSPYEPEPFIFDDGEDQKVIDFNRERSFCLNYMSLEDGKMKNISSLAFSGGTEDIQKWIHVCQDAKIKDDFQVMPIPRLVEDWFSTNSMFGVPINITAYTPIVSSLNNTSDFNDYLHLPDNRIIYMSDVVNPWFSFDITKPHVWNYGCPTFVFSIQEYSWATFFGFSYIGRLGERRGVDRRTAETRVAVNDAPPTEEVLENLQWGQLPSEGKIDFEFVDTNVAIDGIPGKNVCRVGFDMSRADWQPPTLQLVRFVDTDDNFIDRYAKSDDGVIEFYGGDFRFHQNPETYVGWYTEEAATEVKVEYAPYGTDSFLPLDVENVAERDFMPGFGTYYRGSLAGVDRKSENGWFDVRITLTDAAGNFQEQTLSPAFKIEGSVGVETIENNVTEVGRYDLNGKAITADYEGIGVIRYSDGSTKKIVVRK